MSFKKSIKRFTRGSIGFVAVKLCFVAILDIRNNTTKCERFSLVEWSKWSQDMIIDIFKSRQNLWSKEHKILQI